VTPGVVVLRPVVEGRRCDLVFDGDGLLLRVQCKSASRRRNVVVVNARTRRLTPRGSVSTEYDASEVAAIAAYCAEQDACSFIPIDDVAGQFVTHLRLAPGRRRPAGRDKIRGNLRVPRGYSSAGRASRWQREGRRFEPD
jgi:hypothetical protein